MGENESSQQQPTDNAQTAPEASATNFPCALNDQPENAQEEQPSTLIESNETKQQPTGNAQTAPEASATSALSNAHKEADENFDSYTDNEKAIVFDAPKANGSENELVENLSNHNLQGSGDSLDTGGYQYQRASHESEGRNEFIKAVITQILEVSHSFSKNIIEVMDKELASYVLAHINEYPQQEGLNEKLQRRVNYLSKDENAEKFRILLKDPAVLKSNKSVKYQVLMIQRNAFGAEYAEGRTKEIYEENKKYMTTCGFAYKKGWITKQGHALMCWKNQLNDVATIMALSDEELDQILGMKGLPGYKKRAILLHAYDVSTKKTHELDVFIEAIMQQIPKDHGESDQTTAKKLKDFVIDWWKHNTVEEKVNDDIDNEEEEKAPEVRATEFQTKIHVEYQIFMYKHTARGERIRYIPGETISIVYEVQDPETHKVFEESKCDPPFDSKTKEDLENAIKEDILDFSIYANQDTEMTFECITQESLDEFLRPTLYFSYSITETGIAQISFHNWKDSINITSFKQKEIEDQIIQGIKKIYPIKERHRIILICDHNDRLVPRNLIHKNNDNEENYKE